ncbi:MAG TPA: DUF2332 family protein [Sphingomonas sp.]|nr:DUF2332 family protein [Sphingomonas sp.]
MIQDVVRVPSTGDGPGELARQAAVVRELGSPFVAEILHASDRQLARAPRLAELIATWPGDPAKAALAMRLNAALHALARRAPSSPLGRFYAGEPLDADRVIGSTLASEDGFLAEWMQHPPQTNEVSRAGAVMAALLVLRRDVPLPVDLLEIGASAGLNLNMARYRHLLGGVQAGEPGSIVAVAPHWSGPAPPAGIVEIGAAKGVDLHPLDPADPAACERLLAYVFVDQPERIARLSRALRIAQEHPPTVERGDAVPWLAAQLSEAQVAGRCRVVLHSMVLQYFADGARRAFGDVMAAFGARATAERPLARIGFEWNEGRREVRLSLTVWPGQGTRILANCHPYGAAIAWR